MFISRCLPNQSIKPLEATFLVSGVVSLALATLALNHGYLIPACGGYTLAGGLLIQALIYRWTQNRSSEKRQKEDTTSDLLSSLPNTTFAARRGFVNDTTNPISKEFAELMSLKGLELFIKPYDCKTFVNPMLTLSVKELMSIYLDWAVREGYEKNGTVKKKVTGKPFITEFQDAIDYERVFVQETNFPTECFLSEIAVYDAGDIGAAQTKGGLSLMEDVYFIQDFSKGKLIALCDGHRDSGQVGRHLREQFCKNLEKEISDWDDETKLADDLTRLMVQFNDEILTDEQFFRMREIEGGATLLAALVLEKRIYILNVGDSRAVLFKENTFYQLNQEASPETNRFKQECQRANHPVQVVNNRGHDEERVEGKYAVTRDIGAASLSPQPDITRIYKAEENSSDDLNNMTLYYAPGNTLILASDGLWERASNREVQTALLHMQEKKPSEIATHLVNKVLNTSNFNNMGLDNTTVIVMKVES